MQADAYVNDYLERLAQAAQSLPARRREELLVDVRSHIAESGATSEAQVRNVLERLGTPEDIVAAYDEAPASTTAREPRLRWQEYAALLLLPFGGFLFFVGWFAGVILLWTSDRWRASDKILGTLVLPFGYLPVMVLSLQPMYACGAVSDGTGAMVETCSGLSPWIGIPLFLLLSLVPVLVVTYLAKRAARTAHDLRRGRKWSPLSSLSPTLAP